MIINCSFFFCSDIKACRKKPPRYTPVKVLVYELSCAYVFLLLTIFSFSRRTVFLERTKLPVWDDRAEPHASAASSKLGKCPATLPLVQTARATRHCTRNMVNYSSRHATSRARRLKVEQLDRVEGKRLRGETLGPLITLCPWVLSCLLFPI